MADAKKLIADGLMTFSTLVIAFLVNIFLVAQFGTKTMTPMVFVLGVFIVSWRTQGYFWGIAASLISVLGEDWRSFLYRLAETYPCQLMILGRGGKGAALYQRSTGQITELPAAYAGPVVNTVGAGDALFSSFLHFYAKGHAPEEALRRAQVFAAHKITVTGASNGFVTEEIVEQSL